MKFIRLYELRYFLNAWFEHTKRNGKATEKTIWLRKLVQNPTTTVPFPFSSTNDRLLQFSEIKAQDMIAVTKIFQVINKPSEYSDWLIENTRWTLG